MANVTEIEQAEIQKATTQVAQHLTKATELARAIKDEKTYIEAAEYLVTVKTFRKWVKGFFKPAKDKLNAAKNEVLAMESQLDEPAERSERILAPAIDSYLMEKERARRAEEDRINRELREKAEAAKLAAAVDLEQQGQQAEAEEVFNAPVAAPTAVLPKSTPKVAGLTPSIRWYAEVVDKMELLKAIVAGKVDPAAVDVNMPYFNGLAVKQKEAFNYPGMAAKSRNTFAGR